eukprot:593655-Prorocentrum_minimum.AAC.2
MIPRRRYRRLLPSPLAMCRLIVCLIRTKGARLRRDVRTCTPPPLTPSARLAASAASRPFNARARATFSAVGVAAAEGSSATAAAAAGSPGAKAGLAGSPPPSLITRRTRAGVAACRPRGDIDKSSENYGLTFRRGLVGGAGGSAGGLSARPDRTYRGRARGHRRRLRGGRGGGLVRGRLLCQELRHRIRRLRQACPLLREALVLQPLVQRARLLPCNRRATIGQTGRSAGYARDENVPASTPVDDDGTARFPRSDARGRGVVWLSEDAQGPRRPLQTADQVQTVRGVRDW